MKTKTPSQEDYLRSIAEQCEMAAAGETITGFNGIRIPVSDIAKCARMGLGAPTPLGAAAPELLEVCKEDALWALGICKRWLEERGYNCGEALTVIQLSTKKIEAAIAKAEGN